MITALPESASGTGVTSTALPAVCALVGFGLLIWPIPGWIRSRRRRSGPGVLRRGDLSTRARRCLVWGAGGAAATVLVGGSAILVGVIGGLGLLAAVGVPRRATVRSLGRAHRDGAESWRTAALFDLLATALEAGLPMQRAIEAVAEVDDSAAAAALREVGRLLVLGAPPADAWGIAAGDPALSAVAAAAVRSAVGGVKVADAARDAARSLRERARTVAERSAARAEVALTAPLALCFLPAFLCLGLAPVIIGLVGTLHLF